MKRLFVLLLVCIMMFSGCATENKEAAVTSSPEPTPSAEPTPEPESDSRIIAVMIDNDSADARPHAGIEDAFLIYEAYVEGSATRMMALFKDAQTKTIGPVRSSRHYFLDYAMENDAIYVHYGWSPKAQSDISSYGINNINGVSDGGSIFWRDSTYTSSWHTAYTSIENITKFAQNTKKYRTKSEVSNFNKNATDKATGDMVATSVTIPYAGFYKVKYEFDAASKTYYRYINGAGHITQSKNHIAPKNIIIQKATNYTIAGDTSGRQELNTVGTGEGLFISCGKAAKITWSKSDRKAKTQYRFEDGREIYLNPGQTWVQIVPPSMELTIG